MSKVDRDFFDRSALIVAKELIGKIIETIVDGKTVAGRIVETEAYLYKDDPASHSYRGQTKRNKSMFARPGTIYVYQSYGIHFCLNITTGSIGYGEAVLIRALEPLMGIRTMQIRRGSMPIEMLCNGPGKLTKALGITLTMDGLDLLDNNVVRIYSDQNLSLKIVPSRRIGISAAADLEYRFTLAESRYLSR